MPKEVSVPGYTYCGERQAVFDAIIGRLPKEVWFQLPYRAQVLLVAVVVIRNPDKYKLRRGYYEDPFPRLICSVMGVERLPAYGAVWSKAALGMGLLKYNNAAPRNKRVKFLSTDDLSAVFEQLALYNKDPSALTPAGWELARRKAKELREDPDISHNPRLGDAVAYLLLSESGACKP